eukprot:TRINITY_DN29995_c0_g1_i1.p1 TRINITY_DN29995_c0_g1~~TRINITY_DN29995_c0_g1_i1.p1  ORF type:complete len:180 (-),score=15.21 TRINITY_DN29995_c0_g1_i1:189-728(-)
MVLTVRFLRPSFTASKNPWTRYLSSKVNDRSGQSSLVEQKQAAFVEGQRLRVQASRVSRPFRETGGSTQGAATLMALLMRPTSPSLLRLCTGLVASTGFVAAAHWALHPSDPFCVLSTACGAFAYVAVVGTSHSTLWYAIAAPTLMFALLVYPKMPESYAASLEQPKKVQVRTWRRHDY